jgi:hypothetical protein
MTAAVAIEVGIVGHTALGQGQGARWNDAAAEGKSPSSVPGAESFRSNLQAQLASLGSRAHGPVAESESAELTGTEFKNGDRLQPAPLKTAANLHADQILPARVSLGETLGGSRQTPPGLAGSGERSIGVGAGAGSLISHRTAKSESEKASVTASPEPMPAAAAIPSIGAAIQSTPIPATNPVQANRKPVEAGLSSSLPVAVALNTVTEISPWAGVAAGPKAGAPGAAIHPGTLAQLPTVPSWTETGAQVPVGNNPMLNRLSGEPGKATDERRIDADVRNRAVEESRPIEVAGNRTGHVVDVPARETVRTATPVEGSRPAEQTSQLARMTALPGTGDGTGQAGVTAVSIAAARTGTDADAAMNPGIAAGIANRIAANTPSNPLPGSVPALLSVPVQAPVQSPLVTELPKVNPGPAEAIKSGARGAVAGVAGAAHVDAGQTPPPGVANAAGWVRDGAGMVQAQAGISDNSLRGTVEPALGEPFAALDAEPAPAALAWTHAGARQAEAGYQDPVLGWVGVRAELSGGGVHAALVPGSVEAAEQLGRQMDGLHTYLAEQRTPVESLVMAAPSGSGADSGAGGGFGHAAQHEMGQGTGQGAGRNAGEQAAREAESRTMPVVSGAGRAADSPASIAPIGSDVMAQSGGGTRISLVA